MRDRADAKTLLSLLRARWLIESQFQILDAHLAEDLSRARIGHAVNAISSIRHMAINLAQKLGSARNEVREVKLICWQGFTKSGQLGLMSSV